MEDQDGYMVLDHMGRPSPLRGAGPGIPETQRVPTAAPRCPRCLLGALTATLALSLVLCVSWWVAERGQTSLQACPDLNGIYRNVRTVLCPTPAHQQSEGPRSGNTTLDNALLELRKVLCSSQPPGGEACRLCPMGWMLGRTKCYWVSDEYKSWSKSKEDCRNLGASLLVPWDQNELDLLRKSLQRPLYNFWIGYYIPLNKTDWTWVNSKPTPTPGTPRFQVDPRLTRGYCAMIRGNEITRESCSKELQWICQREAA